MIPIPESPRCLLSQEKVIVAAKSLQWFRGGVDTSEELAQVSDTTKIFCERQKELNKYSDVI